MRSFVRRSARVLLGATAGALTAQYVPSVLTLGAFASRARPGLGGSLPANLCTWWGPTDTAQVALTFDDGPSAIGTSPILDALDDLGLKATFFFLGSLIAQEKDLVLETVRRGHQVETHGHEHRHHLLRGPFWPHSDLTSALRTMDEIGLAPNWFRPSYGQLTGATLLAARRHHLGIVLWSAWGREWSENDPEIVSSRVARDLGPGCIVLLHDNDAFGQPGMWRTSLEALPMIASELGRRSLKSVTLDQLAAGERELVKGL